MSAGSSASRRSLLSLVASEADRGTVDITNDATEEGRNKGERTINAKEGACGYSRAYVPLTEFLGALRLTKLTLAFMVLYEFLLFSFTLRMPVGPSEAIYHHR